MMGKVFGLILSVWPKNIRLLPVVMGFALFLLGVKTVYIVSDVGNLVSEAHAASPKALDNITPAAGVPAKNAQPQANQPLAAGAVSGQPLAAGATSAGSAVAAADNSVADTSAMSRSEIGLLQELSARRGELKQRESQLDMRERLLQATEKRIDDKIAAVKSVEEQIKQLTTVHDQQDDAKLKTLVKVYESMKPQDAARILEKLDSKIMISVVTGMSERKIAPVMAAMNPESAKALTTELATRKPLPTVDPGS
jgi:flagellar motility protein MotE (MotC chaperone)